MGGTLNNGPGVRGVSDFLEGMTLQSLALKITLYQWCYKMERKGIQIIIH